MKRLLSVLLVPALVLGACACSMTPRPQRFTATLTDYFDTVTTVVAYDESQSAFDTHLRQFEEQLAVYDTLYDKYHDGDMPNLKTVNETAAKGAVKVDERLMDLLLYGKEVYALSGGKTNICLGAVLALWHEAQETKVLPEKAALQEAARHTAIQDLVLDEKNGTVFFTDEALQLDVGAIAKGYVANAVLPWAKSVWSAAMLNLGGNVVAFGYKENDGKSRWNIAIENPDQTATDTLATVQVTELSVITSGDYQRYFEANGKRYCHIINPDTLQPSEYFSSVTVICPDAALGDALSTTLFNLSLEEGKALLRQYDNVEVLWVDKAYNQIATDGFKNYQQ